MARLTSKLTLVIGLCVAVAMANVASNPADAKSQVICNKGFCYPRVFRPTNEFQEVLEGQEIPGGLHVQMDFETHRKYAKLMDPEDAKSKGASDSVLVVDTETPGVFQHDINSNKPSPIDIRPNNESDEIDRRAAQIEASRLKLQTAFGAIPELDNIANETESTEPASPPNNMSHGMPPSANRQYFNEQLDIVRTDSSSHDDVLEALEALADIASDMEFGLLLTEKDGLQVLQKRLYCGEAARCHTGRLIRAKAAVVIAASLQNHHEAQEQALKNNLDNILLARLEAEKDERVLLRLLSAYTNLVRGGNGKIREKDVRPLAKIFTDQSSPAIRQKFVYMVTDYVDPDMQYNATSSSSSSSQSSGKEEKVPKLNVGPWCEILQEPALGEDIEQVDQALNLLHSYNPDACPLSNNKNREEL
ncbi:nucleotide exchange factor sil1 [Podila epigama]|nr:nucleotide exchange factor sil1 [Podila epigama]